MGKKGKSKGGTAPEPAKPVVSTNAPIVIKEEPKIVKVEEPKVIEPVIAPKVEKVPEKAPSKAPEKVAQKAPEKVPQKAPEKIEKLPEKVEKLPEKIVKIEPVVESTPAVQSESPEGETTLSKSQKKRLRKKKSNNGDESEPKQDSPTTEQTENGEGGEKKKKHRKRKGNKSIVDVEEIKAAIQKKLQEIPVDAKKDDPSKKNKKKPQESAPAPIIEAPVVNIPEATQLAPESPTAARNGNKKNQKRAATSSNPKTSIPDELKIKQEQDQQKAREELQKEIESREKLLEKIEQVLDSRKGDVEAAVSQQNILGKMGKELTKIQEQKAKLAADVKAAAAAKIQSPKENELVKKIERVVDVTKIEIENVQNQQAFVGQLEAQLAKVKNTKDKYMRGDHSEEATSSKDVKLPPHIEKLKQEIVDIKKGAPKRPPQEIIKEIESRDLLMSEISKVLDTTKAEIKKVQKQQEVIASLGTELHRQKEAETTEKLQKMQSMGAEKFLQSEGVKEPADKLDQIIADVEALKKQTKKPKEEAPKEPGTQVMIVKKDKIDQINNNEGIMKLFNMMQDIRKLPPREPTVTDPISGKTVEEPKSFKAPIAAAVEAVLKPTEEILKALNKPVVVDEVKKCPVASVQEKDKSQSPKQGKKGNQNQNNSKKDSGKKSPEQEKKLSEPVVVKEEVKAVEPQTIAPTQAPIVLAPVAPVVVKEEKKIESAPIPIKDEKKVEKRETPQNSPKFNSRASQKSNGKKSPVVEKKSQEPEKPSGPAPIEVVIDSTPKPSLAEILKIKAEAEQIVETPVEVKKVETIKTEKKIVIPAFDSFDDDEEMDMEPFFDEVPKFPINNGPDAKPDATPVIAQVEVVAVPKPKLDEIKKSEVAPPKKIEPKTEVLAPIQPTLPIESLVESKNVESGDSASTAKNDAKSLKNDKNAKQKTPPKNQKAPAKNNLTVTKNDAQRQRSKSPKEKLVEKKVSAPVEVKPKAPSPKASPEKEIKPVSKPVVSPARVAAKSPTKKPELPPKPDFLKNGNTQKSPSPPLAAKTSPIEIIKPVAPQPQPTKQSPVTKPAAPQPQSTKKPSVPPRPANLKSSPAKKPNTAKGPKVSTPATFSFRPQQLQPSSWTFSQAFRETMDEETFENDKIIDAILSEQLEETEILEKFNVAEKPSLMSAFISKDGNIKIILPEVQNEQKTEFNLLSKEVSLANIVKSPEPKIEPKCATKTPFDLMKPLQVFTDENENEYFEFKLSPRRVFMATVCQVCKVNLLNYFPCKNCKMVNYCNDEHLKTDAMNHKQLCLAIQEISKKRGGHVYNMASNINTDEFRNLRVHTINLCEKFLNRQLLPFEREVLMFPRICFDSSCRECRSELLTDCAQCGQISHCPAHPLTDAHANLCSSFSLYQKLVLRQKCFGRIEPHLPQRVLKTHAQLTDDFGDLMRLMYKDTTLFQDSCFYASLTQVSSCPVTALLACQKSGVKLEEQFIIHLIGAELQFEADTLDKWEAFFLHLVPTISELRVVFIGPELNTENLPMEIISRTRMCKSCRQQCRGVTFDFHCLQFYHDFCESSSFCKPNLICFFNAGLNRKSSFKGFDTWPMTIIKALEEDTPILVTSSTEHEAPLDLLRMQEICGEQLMVIQEPTKNPFASKKPERNFISDDLVPLTFKNYSYFVVKKADLSD